MIRSDFVRHAAAATFLVCCSLTSSAQNREYRAALKDYLEASNAMYSFTTAIDQMIGVQREQNADLPAEFWDRLRSEMLLSVDDIVDMLSPVYERHLNIEDLHAVTAFYRSPAGSRLAEASPRLLQESMNIGAEWGSRLGERIMRSIQKKRD